MLENCPECSSQISSRAELCPKCGYPIKKIENSVGFSIKDWMLGIIGILLLIFLIRMCT